MLFLFLLDGNIRDRWIRIVSTNFVRKVVQLFCIQESDIGLFFQVSVGLLDPELLFLETLVHQQGNLRLVGCSHGLGLLFHIIQF